MRKSPIAMIVLVPLLAGAGGCASAPTKAADQPGLVIPLPPPRVVPITAEPILEPVGEIPGANAPTSGTPATRTGRGNREAPPKPAASEARPEAKTGAEATLPEAPPGGALPPVPTGPPPQLRTAESPGTEATVRAQVDRARQILSTVDYRRQSSERRKAYDDAKRFADQADEALRQGNVVFALGVAAKAETLAKELAGR